MVTSIGILHKGRLREHGPVMQVLSSLKQATSVIALDIVGDPTPCRNWLTERHIKAKPDPKHPSRLEVELAGDEIHQAQLLKDIVSAGFSVHGFQARRSSLEDLMRFISAEPDEELQS